MSSAARGAGAGAVAGDRASGAGRATGWSPRRHKQHKRKYRRWQRAEPMHLWQLDIVGGVPLADGRECKMVTGIDDHSRFVVIAAVVAVPSGRGGLRGVHRGDAPLRGSLGGAHRQRQAVHRQAHPAAAGRGAVRADLPGQRHHRTADQTPLTDDHRQDRAVPQDTARGVPRPRRPVRVPDRRAGSRSTAGSPATTTSGRTSRWTWPPRPACSAPTAPPGSRSPQSTSDETMPDPGGRRDRATPRGPGRDDRGVRGTRAAQRRTHRPRPGGRTSRCTSGHGRADRHHLGRPAQHPPHLRRARRAHRRIPATARGPAPPADARRPRRRATARPARTAATRRHRPCCPQAARSSSTARSTRTACHHRRHHAPVGFAHAGRRSPCGWTAT